MKTHVWLFGLLLFAASAVAANAADDLTSTITIFATDPQAVEASGDTGTFTIRRAGGTNFSQLIFYVLSGTASNGVDYQELGNTVQMGVGVTAVTITVRPLSDSLSEGVETVIAQIVASPLDCVTCGYDIGTPNTAEIDIYDDVADPRNGLYQINSGIFTACCGFAGNDLGYDLPSDDQTFIRLQVTNNSATMTFLGADAQTIFAVVPCPGGPTIPFSFSHGLVFPDRLVFHVDPGPVSWWNYTVSNSANQLHLDGVLGLVRPNCIDAPSSFGHSNVLATLVPTPPRIEGVARQGGSIQFHFTGEPPYDYFVERTASLAAPNWQSMTNFRAKLATIQATVTDPISNNAAGFYRIRKQPCLCRDP